MHNRIRMVTASFLTKDLHVWWPVGARHFLDHLVDGDIASNNHGWQWVAGTGTDASPYFRVFNPVTQGLRFDPRRRLRPALGARAGAPAGSRGARAVEARRRLRPRLPERSSTTPRSAARRCAATSGPRMSALDSSGAAHADRRRCRAARSARSATSSGPPWSPGSPRPHRERRSIPPTPPGRAGDPRRRRGRLGFALRIQPGDPMFYVATSGWPGLGTGALASGPLHLGRAHTRAGGQTPVPSSSPSPWALCCSPCSSLGALVVARIPVLRDPVRAPARPRPPRVAPAGAVLTASTGSPRSCTSAAPCTPRSARRHAVAITTVVYALTTAGAGIPLLVLAAGLLGLLTALQRRVTGGILGPVITHLTWSLGMLFLLPAVLSTGS